jgi:hypothetical protein
MFSERGLVGKSYDRPLFVGLFPPRENMTTEAQLAANHANSLKSTGPKSTAGRARSAMNALKHGLRSRKAALLREDTYAFETRKQK